MGIYRRDAAIRQCTHSPTTLSPPVLASLSTTHQPSPTQCDVCHTGAPHCGREVDAPPAVVMVDVVVVAVKDGVVGVDAGRGKAVQEDSLDLTPLHPAVHLEIEVVVA